MNYESKATTAFRSRSFSLSHLILAAFPRRELHVRLVFNHSSRHILYLSLPRSLLCSDLQSKQPPRRREKQRNSFSSLAKRKKKLASSRCCIFKFFTALKTRNNKATERSFKWNFIMPRRCHNESWRPLNIFSHLFLVVLGRERKFKTHSSSGSPAWCACRPEVISLLCSFSFGYAPTCFPTMILQINRLVMYKYLRRGSTCLYFHREEFDSRHIWFENEQKRARLLVLPFSFILPPCKFY